MRRFYIQTAGDLRADDGGQLLGEAIEFTTTRFCVQWYGAGASIAVFDSLRTFTKAFPDIALMALDPTVAQTLKRVN